MKNRLFTIFALATLFSSNAALADSHCKPVDLNSDAVIDLSVNSDKYRYIDFWASWCGPCRASFPFMNELQEKFADKLDIIAISVDDNKSDALSFLKKTPAEFVTALDSSGACPSKYQVTAMPSSFLIAPDGKIVLSHRGFRKNDAKKLHDAIAAKLGE